MYPTIYYINGYVFIYVNILKLIIENPIITHILCKKSNLKHTHIHIIIFLILNKE